MYSQDSLQLSRAQTQCIAAADELHYRYACIGSGDIRVQCLCRAGPNVYKLMSDYKHTVM